MKKCLILVLSSDFPPYSEMIKTSMCTWDSVYVKGVETIFYTSELDNVNWINTDRIRYFPVGNGLFDMGWKNLSMFEWALQNKEFDYVGRINASCYCDKKKLLNYVQTLPDENVFCGVEVKETDGKPSWCFGGMQFIISRDVIQKIIDNKRWWQHDLMEDMAISFLVNKVGVPFVNGIKSCSIDQQKDGWICISYCGESLSFTNFIDLKDKSHFFYRVKQDGQRWLDAFIMNRLFEVLK